MNRMKPYDVPHKGLRNALSQLSLLAGKTDYSKLEEVAQLRLLGDAVFKILTIHASDENEVTLAELEARCPGCSKHDMDDHERLHHSQNGVEALLAEIYAGSVQGLDMTVRGEELYLAFSEFHSLYLEHTAEEERVTQPLLWKHFSDEELASHRGKIMSRIPPETLLIWLRFIIPAQSHVERTSLLAGLRQMAPPAFFDQSVQVIRQELAQGEFDRLVTAIG